MQTKCYGLSRHILSAIMFGLLILGLIGSGARAQGTDTLWIENWESNWEDRWHADYGTWEVGMPTSGPDTTHEGVKCAATILAGNYTEGQSTRLIRDIPFTVPSASEHPVLRLWHWYSFNCGDYGEVQIRAVGQTSWTTLGSGSYAGNSSGHWTRPLLDLSAYAGQQVEMCFHFHSASCNYSTNVDAGWYIDEITIETGQRVFHNPEDWESGIDDWHADYGVWTVGKPKVGVGPGVAHSDSSCAGTMLDGNYWEGEDSRLISAPFTVPDASTNPRLRLWHWYSFNCGDYGEVQIRAVGQTSWTTLGSGSYAGNSSGHWTRPLLDLSAYAGQQVEMCFHFHSASCNYSTNVDAGWYIDEITIETGQRVFHNPEDWESGIDDWHADYGVWTVGKPKVGVGPGVAHSDSSCAGTMLDGNYWEGEDSRLISAPFTVPDASTNPRLRLWHWYSFNCGDYGEVQIRAVGQTSWTTLGSGSYAGNSSGHWTRPLLDLSAYAGQQVEMCFHFHSASCNYSTNVDAGWYIDEITIETGQRVFHNPEDWESGIDDWHADYGVWTVGKPKVGVGPGVAHSDSSCAGTMLDGNYWEGEDSRLISAPFTVPDASTNPRLRLWHWYSFNCGDYGEVQIRAVGQTSWTTLGSGSYAGNSSGHWTRPLLDLSAYAGQQVEMCFHFHSASCNYSTNVDAGWYIDEITIETGQRVFHNPEDWESGIDDWHADYGVWTVGKPKVGVGPGVAHSDSSCAGTMLDGNYWEGEDSRLISAPFTVPDASTNPRLRLWHWYSFNCGDGGEVQIRAVGQTSWTTLPSGGYSGSSSNAWTYPSFALSTFSATEVEICFHFHSSSCNYSTNVGPGWYIDDVKIVTTCPYIYCPPSPVNATATSQGQVLVPLQIWNPDSVFVSNGSWANDTLRFVADTMGAYDFTVVAKNTACADTCSFTVNVSGVKVADEMVAPGGKVKVPIMLSTSQALGGYTIPLQFNTTQLNKVHLDSVRLVDPLPADSAFIVDSTHFIVYRPMQLPPLPPDTAKPYTVAEAYFSIAADAQAEVILIDTTTIVTLARTYTYEFIDTLDTAYVPLFVPGSITITDTVVYACGDFDADGMISITDVVYLIAYIFSGGPAPLDVSGGDVDCSGSLNIADAVYMIQYIFGGGPAPCANCLEDKALGKNEVLGAEMWLETELVGDSSVITVVFKSPVSIAGLQIELSSSANEEIQIADLSGGMAVYAGQQGVRHKIGMLDITGHQPIPAGESRALRLSMKSEQTIQITEAILVGTDARPLSVVVKENRSMIALPDRFELAQNCPNPFNPTTQIRYSLPVASQIHLEVLNVLGQHVATLVNGDRPAGVHQASWEGVDDQGRSVASGVYFYRLRTESFTQTRRMVLLK